MLYQRYDDDAHMGIWVLPKGADENDLPGGEGEVTFYDQRYWFNSVKGDPKKLADGTVGVKDNDKMEPLTGLEFIAAQNLYTTIFDKIEAEKKLETPDGS